MIAMIIFLLHVFPILYMFNVIPIYQISNIYFYDLKEHLSAKFRIMNKYQVPSYLIFRGLKVPLLSFYYVSSDRNSDIINNKLYIALFSCYITRRKASAQQVFMVGSLGRYQLLLCVCPHVGEQ